MRNIKIQRGKNPRTQRNVIMNSERTEFSILYVRLLLVYLCVILSLSLCLCLSVCAWMHESTLGISGPSRPSRFPDPLLSFAFKVNDAPNGEMKSCAIGTWTLLVFDASFLSIIFLLSYVDMSASTWCKTISYRQQENMKNSFHFSLQNVVSIIYNVLFIKHTHTHTQQHREALLIYK